MLRDLDAWSLRGRVALSTAQDSFSGAIYWAQEEEDLDLSFRAPLGLGGFRVTGDDELIEVEMSNGQSFLTEDPGPAFQRAFGWSLPLRSLRYWIVGLPDPAAEHQEVLDPRGTPSRLRQGGWVVEYERFERVSDALLPTKLRISGRDVRIRLAVDHWEVSLTMGAPATAAAAAR